MFLVAYLISSCSLAVAILLMVVHLPIAPLAGG